MLDNGGGGGDDGGGGGGGGGILHCLARASTIPSQLQQAPPILR